MQRRYSLVWLKAFGLRSVLALLIWVALTGPGWTTYGWGAAFALAVAALSLNLAPPAHSLRLPAALRAVGFLLRESVTSGFDIALRALLPSRPLYPELLELDLRDSPGLGVPMAMALSAIPGTLAVDLEEGRLTVHVLDCRRDNRARLGRLRYMLEQALPGLPEGR